MRKRSEAKPAETGPEVVEEEARVRRAEEASSELAEKLREAEDVSDPSFGSLPGLSLIHPAFERVVSRVFVDEEKFDESYDKLTGLLRALEGRSERAFQREHLTRAAEGHSLATRLYTTAQRILANWEADNAQVVATMRERAYRELQVEKDQKSRNKTITDRDVDDRTTLLYPTQFRQFEKRRGEYSLMVKNLEMNVKSFDHLCGNLRSLVQSS